MKRRFVHWARRTSVLLCAIACATAAAPGFAANEIPNGFPFPNAAGTAGTVSTAGAVDLDHAFHSLQGANGRTCESCHLPHAGWSVRPIDVELMFLFTGGTDPLFNTLDADSPTAPMRTVKERLAAYSMLRKGLFRRGGNLPADAEFEIVAFDDPLKAGASATRFEFFRRPLATANFHIARNIGWHDQNTNGSGDVHTGLVAQATGAFSGAIDSSLSPMSTRWFHSAPDT